MVRRNPAVRSEHKLTRRGTDSELASLMKSVQTVGRVIERVRTTLLQCMLIPSSSEFGSP